MGAIAGFLKASWKAAWAGSVWFWKLILIDPAKGQESIVAHQKWMRNVGYWRSAWLVAGILWTVLAATAAPSDKGVVVYCLFGIPPVVLTAVLVRRRPVGGVHRWRLALCGVICISLPYLVPGIFYNVLKIKLPGSGNPWLSGVAAFANGLTCLVMICANIVALVLSSTKDRDT